MAQADIEAMENSAMEQMKKVLGVDMVNAGIAGHLSRNGDALRQGVVESTTRKINLAFKAFF